MINDWRVLMGRLRGHQYWRHWHWLVAPALVLLLYHRGLQCWFHRDDFSALLVAALPPDEFWRNLFEPRAQGTFRPLSERLFFYSFFHWFGLDANPYRAWVFVTQVANLFLLNAVARRLLPWRGAGVVAASLWGLHFSLATSMSWTSAYNQVLCAFFLLASFLLFLRFLESGKVLYYVAQWLTFLLGFGALETIVVYPAILLLYALLFARYCWKYVVPMLLASGGLVYLQIAAAPLAREGVYRPDFGAGALLGTLHGYAQWTFGGVDSQWIGPVLVAAAAATVAYQAFRGRSFGVFALGWLVIAAAPYLPLSEHTSEYYLVIPAIGSALLGAWLGGLVWSSHRRWAPVAAAALGLHLYGSIPRAMATVDYNRALSVQVRNLLSGLSYARAAHPDKTILLAKVSEDVYHGGIHHEMFRVAGLFDIYLTPDMQSLRARGGQEVLEQFCLTREETVSGVRRGSIVIYDASGPRLREITKFYSATAETRLGP